MPGFLRVERRETVSESRTDGHNLSVVIGYCVGFRTGASGTLAASYHGRHSPIQHFQKKETPSSSGPSPAPGSVALQDPHAVSNLNSCTGDPLILPAFYLFLPGNE